MPVGVEKDESSESNAESSPWSAAALSTVIFSALLSARTGVATSSAFIAGVISAETDLLPFAALIEPFMLMSARGSIDLRRRDPPRGKSDVSTAYCASSSQMFSRSQLPPFSARSFPKGKRDATYSSTHPTPTHRTTPPASLTFSNVLLPPSLKTTCVMPTFPHTSPGVTFVASPSPLKVLALGFQFHCFTHLAPI